MRHGSRLHAFWHRADPGGVVQPMGHGPMIDAFTR